MITKELAACIVMVLFSLFGCSQPGTGQGQGATPAPEEQATFINKVWKVAESSSVAPGQLYVFLSEGTLVLASPNGKPALGSWVSDGTALTLIEEGLSYKADILKLSKTEFHIRIHNPHEPVDIRFVPAEESLTPTMKKRPS